MSEAHVRTKRVGLVGAVIAAVAASACCTGPLLVALLGVGGAGAFAALGAYRPYLLALSAALLGGAFYLTHRRPRRAGASAGFGPGDACGCELPRRGHAGRIGLWVVTMLVAAFAAAPPVLARIGEHHGGRADVTASTALETAIIHVQGIDCEACAAPLRRALTKVGGLRDLALDVPAQNAIVTYEPTPGRLEAYVAAIDDLGYQASLSRIEHRRGDSTTTRAQ